MDANMLEIFKMTTSTDMANFIDLMDAFTKEIDFTVNKMELEFIITQILRAYQLRFLKDFGITANGLNGYKIKL